MKTKLIQARKSLTTTALQPQTKTARAKAPANPILPAPAGEQTLASLFGDQTDRLQSASKALRMDAGAFLRAAAAAWIDFAETELEPVDVEGVHFCEDSCEQFLGKAIREALTQSDPCARHTAISAIYELIRFHPSFQEESRHLKAMLNAELKLANGGVMARTDSRREVRPLSDVAALAA